MAGIDNSFLRGGTRVPSFQEDLGTFIGTSLIHLLYLLPLTEDVLGGMGRLEIIKFIIKFSGFISET